MADADLSVQLEGADAVKSALSDIALTGANAFEQLTRAIESGDFAGLAELIGGPLAGALVAAAQAAFQFVEAQEQAVVQLKAVADAAGTTIGNIQGLRDTFTSAGFTAEQAGQALSRATLKLAENVQVITERLRDEGAQQEAANERVVASITRIGEAKERLAELSTEQAEKEISNANSVASANQSLAEARQHELEADTGVANPELDKLLQQQRAHLATQEATAALDRARTQQQNQLANEPFETQHAQQGVASAETGAVQARNQAYDKLLHNIEAVSDALNGLGPLVGHLQDVSSRTITLTEQYRTAQSGGNQFDPSAVLKQFAKDSTQISEQINESLRGLLSSRNFEATNRLADILKANQQTPGNLTKILGPEITEKNAESAQKFVDGVNNFKSAVDNFAQKGVSSGVPFISQFLQNSIGGGGRAGGGPISGPGSGTSDTAGVFALSHGEFVMRAAAVQQYGVGLFHALNDGVAMPGFAAGGLVRPVRMNEGGAVKSGDVLHLHLDGQTFGPFTGTQHVIERVKSYAISRKTAQTGSKPSWVG